MDDERPDEPRLTRREALRLAGVTLAATLSPAVAASQPPASPGQPFDDGTYFDDGSGWGD